MTELADPIATLPRAGFYFTGLLVTGPGKEDVKLRLEPGLNVIAGASDSGKSHVLELLDFIMGAKKIEDPPPESDGYVDLYAGIKSKSGLSAVLHRPLAGGDYGVFDGELFERDTWKHVADLLARNIEGDRLTASELFLWNSGFGSPRIRVSGRGKTNRLSFRHVAAMAVLSEDEMWQKISPILSKNGPQNAGRKSTFALMLTGRDDTGLVEVPKPEVRQASLTAQEAVLRSIITSHEAELQRLGYTDRQALSLERAEIQRLQQQHAGIRISTRSEIANAEGRRQDLQRRVRAMESRRAVLSVLLSRFELLAEHYQSDIDRFQALAEVTGGLAGVEPAAACPLCGSAIAVDEQVELIADTDRVATACSAEADRARLLSRELTLTRQNMTLEERSLTNGASSLRAELEQIGELLERQLVPRANGSDGQLVELAGRQSPLDTAEELHRQLVNLRSRLTNVLVELEAKNPPLPPARVDYVGPATRVAELVQNLLIAWSYPELRSVTFDEKKFDVKINGRSRSSHGKGYRAIINAAFLVALLQYCREKELPHPGVVVVDSPVLTLKLPLQPDELPVEQGDSTKVPEQELVPVDMKAAFYRSLRDVAGDDQIIVIENDRIDPELAKTFNYLVFTKRRGRGRYGLFPPLEDAERVESFAT